MSEQYVAAIDQGTTSTRCMIFNRDGRVVNVDQKEHEQIFPRAGWVEHNATEIWNNTREVTAGALAKADLNASDIAAVGITNQRETALVWDTHHRGARLQRDRLAGHPDRRHLQAARRPGRRRRAVQGQGRAAAGHLLLGPEGPLDPRQRRRRARRRPRPATWSFGNMDTWVIWNMTGGVDGGLHITDPTNASRTMLMDLDSLSWDENIADEMGIPVSMLPEIRSSSQVYGEVRERGTLHGVPIAGDLGDQQAATFGQACLSVGEAKNTYGTGNFMLINTGTQKVPSKNGLLTTVCYKIGDQATVYALEGAVAVTGSLVQWVRDNLGLIGSAPEIETLAKTVEDSGGAYFVPAFSGLFAPYWRGDARGAIVGLTRFVNKGHIARAVLEATAFQSKELLDAMNADSGVDLTALKVDGGMVQNETLMQFQADILGVPVIRPVVAETTALGAAYAAGLAVGFWQGEDDIRANWAEDKRWEPNMDDAHRGKRYRKWKKAVTKTFDWVDEDD